MLTEGIQWRQAIICVCSTRVRIVMTACMWKPAPQGISLLSGEVHIWCASLYQPDSSVQRYGRLLSSDELARAARFYFERDKHRFIIGRGILRSLLCYYANCGAEQIQFTYEQYGKPILAQTVEGKRLCFNLSHSQSLAVYAVAWDSEIGIDIEQLRPLDDTEQLVARFFSPREYAIFRSLPAQARTERFYNWWTCKEAYLKARGSGLAMPLDQFEVSLQPEMPPKLLCVQGDQAEMTRWSIHLLRPAPDYTGALVVDLHDPRLSCWCWTCDNSYES
jgi:4'-phosphopantetheinyl transferase